MIIFEDGSFILFGKLTGCLPFHACSPPLFDVPVPSFQSMQLAAWIIAGLLAVHVIVLLVKS